MLLSGGSLIVCAIFLGQTPDQMYVRCTQCHLNEARQFESSVHNNTVECQHCHAGRREYQLTEEGWRKLLQPGPANPPRSKAFEHGSDFVARPARGDIPFLCGECHADVERMNAYGIATDQLKAYWTSAHGKRLRDHADDRVAVCIDCHGIHDVLPRDNPNSRTHFRNVSTTCATCHEDPNLMGEFGLPPEIVAQYRRSVHGHNVLEKGDSGSPHCATCHGSHGAVPPGFDDVSRVCGQCHQQIEEYFRSGIHGRLPDAVRCNECHGKSGDPLNHEIAEASPTAVIVVQALAEVLGGAPVPPADDLQLRSRFAERLRELSAGPNLENVCHYCHGGRRRGPHAQFLAPSDQIALDRGKALADLLFNSQFEYARTAQRVDKIGRGVLLVNEEAIQAQDAMTELLALYAFFHTIDLPKIEERVGKLMEICGKVNESLDLKERHLRLRTQVLWPIWGFAIVFVVLMYTKYRQLRRAYVRDSDESIGPAAQRRRVLNAILGVMGFSTIAAILWPAVAYVLPARRRGGGAERIVAGKESEWDPWTSKKISVHGKPVIVTRTDKGFRAFSAVCTHLGCIVHWDQAQREFICPCHAAKFGAGGQVLAGPPPRPLPEYAVAIVQGEVIIRGAEQV